MTRRFWCFLAGLVPLVAMAGPKPVNTQVVVGNATVTLTNRGVLVVSEGAGLEVAWR